jgi:alginate O-acetyltransferase complex protein AlgI
MVGRWRALFDSIRQLPSAVPTQLEAGLAAISTIQQKTTLGAGGFTVLTIVAFGTLTLALHAELLEGDRAALGLAAFIGIYWTTRIVVDAIYFTHTDWPKGPAFVVGHALLTLLFSFLAASYVALFFWHVWLGKNG